MMGKKLDVKAALQGNDVPQLQGAFTYTVPTVAQYDPGQVDPGQLERFRP